MHYLFTVFRYEFTRTLKKPAFWLSVLSVPVIIIGFGAVLYFSEQAAERSEQQAENEKFSIAVTDKSGIIAAPVLQQAEAATIDAKQNGISQAKQGKIDAYFYYPENPAKNPVEIYAKNVGLVKNSRYDAVATSLLESSIASNISSPQQIAILQTGAQTNVTTYENGEKAGGFMDVIAPGAFIVLLYAVIVLLAGQMLTTTTEEKENRVIEMVLSTVKARSLLLGKMLAVVALGLVQVLTITVPITAGYIFLGQDIGNLPSIDLNSIPIDPATVLLAALIFVIGFFLYTGILVAIGAAVPTAKEANNFFGVIVLILIVPFYAFQSIIADAEQFIVQFLTYFPVTAPITLLLRNAVGNLSPLEAAIGIGVIAISAVAAVAIAVRLFRYGTVEYSRIINPRELFFRKST